MGKITFFTVLTRRRLYDLGSLLLIILLCIFPLRMLLGAWYYHAGLSFTDDPDTPYLDRKDITESSLSDYAFALGYIERANAAVPGMTLYLKTSAEMYSYLERWNATMHMAGFNVSSPFTRKAGSKAAEALYVAITKGPVDPELHMALASVYREQGNLLEAERSLERAVALYPLRPSIHYAVATDYLLMQNSKMALHHARAIAGLDDSYESHDHYDQVITRQRQPDYYRALLVKSYLFKAYEVAWRASFRDLSVIESLTPDNSYARDVEVLFREAKGIK